MRLNGKHILFEASDMPFLKKHGLREATKMVKEHYNSTAMPFIRDTYQLADALCTNRKILFKLLRRRNSFYKEISIPKKSGGSRQLHAPQGMLRAAQSSILRNILNNAPVSRFATAYIKGKSLSNNALPHVGKRYILKMDITDFFGSITFLQVLSAAFPSAVYPKQIGVMLTELCTRKDVLPQGAPTSPALSNIVMRNFDETIGNWCEKRGISYTRYCDDLTFSSDERLYHVYEKAASLLLSMGFEINKKKTHFVTNAARQSVTGIVVNEKLSVPREYKRALRQELHYVFQYGLENALLHRGEIKYAGHSYLDCERYRVTLLGRLDYVLGIEPENSHFKEARARLLYHTEV